MGRVMIFHDITYNDMEKMNRIFKLSDYITAEHSFSNAYNWNPVYKSEVAYFTDDMMVIRINVPVRSHLYPVGKGDVKACILELMEDCKRDGVEFFMHGIQEEGKKYIEENMPDLFRMSECRSSSDYIYSVEKLSVLSGKKLIKKRNHINKFKRLYENWSYENIGEENMSDLIKMKEKWYESRDYRNDEELASEKIAVDRAFENFEKQGLEGGLIKVGDEIVAFTMGSRLNSNTFDIQIEKALVEYEGSYPIINQEFILNRLMDYEYVNREEDLGNEGLRKAKLSYAPEFIAIKYRVCLATNTSTEGPCEG